MHYTQGIVRQPARSLGDGLTTQALGAPDIDLARVQHAAYVAALRQLGVAVTVLAPDEAYPDSCFVEDPAVIWQGVAIMTRPGAAARLGEVNGLRAALAPMLPVVELGGGPDVMLDGGDVLICGQRVLVGLSERTNQLGITQLTARLGEIDPSLTVITVPIAGVLHLKSGMTALTPDLLLLNPECHTDARFDFTQTVLLPVEQGYAANVRPVNDGVIISRGYPAVAALAREQYAQVIELDMSEFHKMDGSLTCLSLLW